MTMQTTIKIKRPNGDIDTVVKSGILGDAVISAMTKANREAGRGEIISAECDTIFTEEEKAYNAEQDTIIAAHNARETRYEKQHAQIANIVNQ